MHEEKFKKFKLKGDYSFTSEVMRSMAGGVAGVSMFSLQ
jgi:hypothetical protein